MADSKPAAEPEPKPEPEKPKIIRGLFNQAQQEALDKAGLVVAAAKKPEYAARLAAGDVSAQFVGQLETDIADCRKRVGQAVDLTNRVGAATAAEKDAQSELLAGLKEIQTRAKQKYARGDADQMKVYFVGAKLDPSRATLIQVAETILGKLKDDTLPGITPAKVTGLKALLDAYVAANAAQSDAQSKVSAERAAIEAVVQGITDRRIQIQFAAEAEWPARDAATAPIRREFQLPPDRPFIG